MYGVSRLPRKPNKQPRKLSHEQKRQFARDVIAGGMVKQVAARWGLSIALAYRILADYTVKLRVEKLPRDPNYE